MFNPIEYIYNFNVEIIAFTLEFIIISRVEFITIDMSIYLLELCSGEYVINPYGVNVLSRYGSYCDTFIAWYGPKDEKFFKHQFEDKPRIKDLKKEKDLFFNIIKLSEYFNNLHFIEKYNLK